MVSHDLETYHKTRKKLMRDILKRNTPFSIDKETEPFCQICKIKESEQRDKELHIEHPDGNKGKKGNGCGGFQMLERYLKQFENNERLFVVCPICHFLLHRIREDGYHVGLLNKREYLKEYKNVDPEFELRKREREGSLYGENGNIT